MQWRSERLMPPKSEVTHRPGRAPLGLLLSALLLSACGSESATTSSQVQEPPAIPVTPKAPPAPLDPSSPLAQARALKRSGALEQALAMLKPEIEKAPEDLEANREYQDLLRALKRVEEGRTWYAQKVQEAPASPARQYLYGRAIIVENPVEAEAAFKRALEKDAAFEWAWLALGTTHTLRGDNFAAVQLYEKALKRFPESAVVHFNLADAQVSIGALRQAKLQVEASLKLDPSSPRGWELLGLIHFRQGDLTSAREALEKALTIDPAVGLGNQVLAELDLREGRIEEARAHANLALKAGKRISPELQAKFPDLKPADPSAAGQATGTGTTGTGPAGVAPPGAGSTPSVAPPSAPGAAPATP